MGNCQPRWGEASIGNGVGCRERGKGASSPLSVMCLFLRLLHLTGTDYLCRQSPVEKDPFLSIC